MTVVEAKSSPTSGTSTDRYLIVSSDSHIGPSVKYQFREYCESRYLPKFDDLVREMDAHADEVLQRQIFDLTDENVAAMRYTVELSREADPHGRLLDMDEEGVTVDVIFHGSQNNEVIPFQEVGLPTDPELSAAGLRIYNRWLADFCSVAPERHVGIAQVPMWDVPAAVEAVEMAREAGLKSVNFPIPRPELPAYNDPVWEPFWSACEANNMVLNCHTANAPTVYTGIESFAMWMTEVRFWSSRALQYMIFGGVFERHPGLKLVFAEQQGDWFAHRLKELDSAYFAPYQRRELRDVVPLPPSEYFKRQCFVGASFMSRGEALLAQEHGLVPNLLWGSDYPHYEGTWPFTTESLRATFAGFETSDVRLLLGENAVRVFDLDRAKLQEIANRIGPTVEELAAPLDERPAGSAYSLGFRQFGSYT